MHAIIKSCFYFCNIVFTSCQIKYSPKLLIPLNLKFYDKPKRLSDFKIIRGTLKNFCYVEELEEVNKADGLKQLYRNMFLYFPWLMFEREIEHSIIDGRIFDLATCKDYITKIETAFNDGMHMYTRNKLLLPRYGYNFDI